MLKAANLVSLSPFQEFTEVGCQITNYGIFTSPSSVNLIAGYVQSIAGPTVFGPVASEHLLWIICLLCLSSLLLLIFILSLSFMHFLFPAKSRNLLSGQLFLFPAKSRNLLFGQLKRQAASVTQLSFCLLPMVSYRGNGEVLLTIAF